MCFAGLQVSEELFLLPVWRGFSSGLPESELARCTIRAGETLGLKDFPRSDESDLFRIRRAFGTGELRFGRVEGFIVFATSASLEVLLAGLPKLLESDRLNSFASFRVGVFGIESVGSIGSTSLVESLGEVIPGMEYNERLRVFLRVVFLLNSKTASPGSTMNLSTVDRIFPNPGEGSGNGDTISVWLSRKGAKKSVGIDPGDWNAVASTLFDADCGHGDEKESPTVTVMDSVATVA